MISRRAPAKLRNSLVPTTKTWNYDEWFAKPAALQHKALKDAEAYVKEIRLDKHPFFTIAQRSVDALLLWTKQELVMTGPFSRIVLRAASMVENVHIRSILMEVAHGEHGKLDGVFAKASHPWLLHLLGESLQIDKDSVTPLPETSAFLLGLEADLQHPLSAIAGIGIGNERLIIQEYTAVKRCFRAVLPQAVFEPFLNANLEEDVGHSRLCSLAAACLIKNDSDASFYLNAAKKSVDRRVSYFDALRARCETAGY